VQFVDMLIYVYHLTGLHWGSS